MRRIAAAKRAEAAASSAGKDARRQAASSPAPKTAAPAPRGDKRAPPAASSFDRLGRAVDLARRKNLTEQREMVLTDKTGAVAVGQVQTLVELMKLNNATTSESRMILLTLGRTAQKAPERLETFAQVGGLRVLALWLRATAPHAQSSEQKAIALGCLRVMAKIPTSQELLEKSKVPSVVKEVARRCSWAQKDVQALLKHWCAGAIWDEGAGKWDRAPGLVQASEVVLVPQICEKPPGKQAGQEAKPSSSSSSSSSSDEEEGGQEGGQAAPEKGERPPEGPPSGSSQDPRRSRFEPRKPEPPPEAKKRRVEDVRVPDAVPQAPTEEDAEVLALLKELESLNELLAPD